MAGGVVLVAPLHEALHAQGCVFVLTEAHLTHSRRLSSSRAVEKTPIFPAVDEERTGRMLRWKLLAWVRQDSQVVRIFGSSPLLLHDVNDQ